VIVGALCAWLAASCVALALRSTSTVEARLARLVGRDQRQRLVSSLRADALAFKVASAFVATLAATAVAATLGIGPLPVPIAAYAGYIAPSIVAERRAARRRRAADRGVITLVEWLHALVSCGRPLETAIDALAARGIGDPLLDTTLVRVRRDYTLGVPMPRALATNGRAAGIEGLSEIARRVEHARELARGALPILGDLRDELRAVERARSLQAASHVDGKLTLVLTLCYLPALALLVIVPLFLTLLAGLFG